LSLPEALKPGIDDSSKHRGIWLALAQYSINRLPVNFRKSVNLAFSAMGSNCRKNTIPWKWVGTIT
jgi:hypothetical protein